MRRAVSIILVSLALAPACAERAPELPPGKTMADVSFTDAGDIVVSGYCVTCCGDDWVPGPEVGCAPDPGGGGGGPYPHPWCPPPDIYCDGP